MTTMSSPTKSSAPGPLETVRRFVNTLDIEAGTDALDSAADVRAWLAGAGLLTDGRVTAGDVGRVHDLREALRAAAAANHDRTPLPGAAVAVLNDAAGRSDLALTITPDRTGRLTAGAGGLDAALGRLVVIVAEAMNAGTWGRFRVCANDACRWAFYDGSRAGTGRWCTMRLCGNRAKQEAWRNRRSAG